MVLFFERLPDEMLVEVCQYLELTDLINMLLGTEDTYLAALRFLNLRCHRIVILDWYVGWGESEALQLEVFLQTGLLIFIAYFDVDTDIPTAMERKMPRLPAIPQDDLEELLFKANMIDEKGKVYGPGKSVWEDLAKDTKGKFSANYIYVYVKSNRHGILTEILTKKGIVEDDAEDNEVEFLF